MAGLIQRLVGLQAELEVIAVGAPYAPQPWQEIVPNDHCVGGILPDDLKQVYVLLAQAQAELQYANLNLNRIAREEGKDPRDAAYTERHIILCRLSVLVQILDAIFTGETKVAFPVTLTKPFVAVRTEWKVVWRDKPEGAGSPAQETTQARDRFIN